jgi:predicted ArsR family transcriptional regulator
MKPTRQRLLDILKNRPNTTAAELSRALQLTQADVRHHLSNMVEEGLVVATGYQRGGRRGRPARKYSIAATALKDNFDLLSSALLAVSLQHLSPPDRIAFLRRVAAHLAGEISPGGPLAQRLVGTVVKLNELGYQARWEAHVDAPRLILEHCPFATLLPQHPELCQLDACLLEILLKEPVAQVESLAYEDEGHCIFLVGKKDVTLNSI